MKDDEVERALAAIARGSSADEQESGTLEFKEQAKGYDKALDDIVEASLCLANAGGGSVVVGVSNVLRGSAAFVGTTLNEGIVRRRIWELTRPNLTVDVSSRSQDEKRLLVVHVPLGAEIHADTKGRVPRRVGTGCPPMTPDQIVRLREERQGIDWSAKATDRTVADIRGGALAVSRNRLALFPDERRRMAKLADEDLLRALGVMDHRGRILRAGELLFCGPRARSQPGFVYQYRRTQGGEPALIRRMDAPMLLAFQRTMQFIEARQNATPLTLSSGQQITIADFPELAVREAVVNAVIHRDYHLTGSVVIDHSPEVFSVSSPGPLVSGVTVDNILTHPSKPRNPLLASATRLLGLAEEVGRGVDRMYREMIRSGREIPKIEDNIDHVRVTLVGGAPNIHIARYVAQLPEEEQNDTDAMIVLHRLCRSKTITAVDIGRAMQKPIDEAETALRRLASDRVGILEPTRATHRWAHPLYRLRSESLKALGSAVPYQRRTVDETDRKIINHVREYGTITNQTVQNLFDVGIHRASVICRDLVARNILVKLSPQERGPGIQYGPGPKFPPKPRKKRQRVALTRPKENEARQEKLFQKSPP